MSSSKHRIDRYVSMASLPAIAAVGGAATVSHLADADIVYQEVSITIGGLGSSPSLGTLDMGVATVGFTAGNVSGVAGMLARGNPQVAIIGSNSAIPKMNRFGAGDTIDAGSSAWLKSGLGAGSIVKSSGKKGSKTFSFGEWALGGDAETSGYMGFALLVGDPVGAGGAPNFGWISLAWDGTFLTIDGYAYETEAGVGIEAGAIPAPGAIGLLGLAAGAAGMRRKRLA